MSMMRVESEPRTSLGTGSARALEFVRRTLESVPEPGSTLAISVPAPIARCETLLRVGGDEDAWLFAPSPELEFAGFGSAELFSASGAERFRVIEQQTSEFWSRLRHVTLDHAPAPRLYGGFAFQPGRAQGPGWRNFGEARFGLAKVGYFRDHEQAFLTFAATSQQLENAAFRRALLASAERVFEVLEAGVEPPSRRVSLAARLSERSEADWMTLIEGIREQIARGHVEKIVAARRVGVELDDVVDASSVLSRLRGEAPECLRFAFRARGTTFLGATPERLITKRGLEIWTEAVAGSVRAGDAASASKLLESPKDIREHEFVVREVVRCLKPVVQSLTCAPRPEIHQLRHVLHLRTKIRGVLSEPRNVLELVSRLHPTPAVGGVPTLPALQWIEKNEPDERGWYAGPIGFLDANGDGEFAVALRSGLLCDKHADLYVGAGVVRDSTAASEFLETRWKLASLLAALGVSA